MNIPLKVVAVRTARITGTVQVPSLLRFWTVDEMTLETTGCPSIRDFPKSLLSWFILQT